MDIMPKAASTDQTLRAQLTEKDARIAHLESLLRTKENAPAPRDVDSSPENQKESQTHSAVVNGINPLPYRPGKTSNATNGPERPQHPLVAAEYQRYGRQMILPEIGLPGQLKLKAARVLIVGIGGLGCPAAAYLAGAGVSTLGLIDGDVVEVSNLHRQILHSTEWVGELKVDSAVEALRGLNPHVQYVPIRENLTPSLAARIFPSYDLILDCTDRPSTRYLVSDAAVLCGKPLVTASAVKTEGQLIVLNNPPKPPGDESGSPCYRCIFPRPPPPESVTSCAEGGILGPVVGTMGVLQALEAIKVITAAEVCKGGKAEVKPTSMLIFSAYSAQQFRNIVFRRRKKTCAVCGKEPKITLPMFLDDSVDYVQLCGVVSPVKVLRTEERVEAEEYQRVKSRGEGHVLIDTRDSTQFGICHIEGSFNVPIEELREGNDEGEAEWAEHLKGDKPVYVVCRLGNDSQEAVMTLKDRLGEKDGTERIRDIRGGLKAWKEKVDGEFPEY